MDNMSINFGINDGTAKVIGSSNVVVDSVSLGLGVLHGVWSSTLFRKMHNRIGLFVLDQLNKKIVIFGYIQVDKLDFFSRNFFPSLNSSLKKRIRGYCCKLKLRTISSTAFPCHILTSGLAMGVKESHPKSRSIFLRDKLSTITTSCPRSDRYKDVGHPQNPSPPKTITFFFSSKPLTPFSPACKAHSKVTAGVDVRLLRRIPEGEKARAAGTHSKARSVQDVFIFLGVF
jgi:hypothetical protein